MNDPRIPVTEDELHAYVDNELPAERRGDVETWLSAHPDDAERVRSWREMAEALHARYDAVADEPVASLDPASADRVLGLLHRICKDDGITAIVSLHQLDFAKRYADRIVALAQGQVVFDGTPSKLGKHEIARIYGATPADAPEALDEDFHPRTGTYA